MLVDIAKVVVNGHLYSCARNLLLLFGLSHVVELWSFNLVRWKPHVSPHKREHNKETRNSHNYERRNGDADVLLPEQRWLQ